MTRIAIFGCGSLGQRVCSQYGAGQSVVAFLDNNRDMHGKKLAGVRVCNPESFDYESVDRVVIASMYLDQILIQLLGLGVAYSKIDYANDDVIPQSSSSARRPRLWSGITGLVQTAFYLPFRLLRRCA